MSTSAIDDEARDDVPGESPAPAAETVSNDDVRWWKVAGAIRDDIRMAHATFARATAARLRRMLRRDMDLTLTGAEWVTGGDWLSSSSAPVVLAWVELPGASSGMAMRLDTAFALSALDRLLGGAGAATADREPTELDLALLHDVFGAPVGAIDTVLGSALTDPPRLSLVVTRPKLFRLAAPTDPMMLLTYRLDQDADGTSPGTLCLAYPEDVVTTVLNQVDAAAPVVSERVTDGDPALRNLVGGIDVEVVARLQPSRFSVHDLRQLRVGDVLSLDHRRDQPIEMSVGGIAVLEGSLGQHGRNVAVRVESWRRDATADSPTPGSTSAKESTS